MYLVGLCVMLFPGPALGQTARAAISGELRVRTVFEHDLVAPGAVSRTLLRTRVGVRSVLSPRMGAFVQIQDARLFGEESSTLTDGSADQLDFHWAYLWIERRPFDTPVRLEVGRQEIVLGNERLVGAVGWSNTGRAFDAARLRIGDAEADWAVSTMVATVAERSGAGDHTLLGVSLDGPTIRADLLHDVNAAEAGASDIDRTTLAWHWRPLQDGAVQTEFEGAYQTGSRTLTSGPQDIRAWFLAGRMEWAPASGPLSAAGVGVDWLSGDTSADVGNYSAFKTLYATNHKFYGLMDFFLDPAGRTGDRGLIDALLDIRVPVADAVVVATGHRFWLAEQDGLASGAIGWEVDLTSSIELEEAGALGLGYALFRASAGAPAASLGPEGSFRHWAFAQLTFRF